MKENSKFRVAWYLFFNIVHILSGVHNVLRIKAIQVYIFIVTGSCLVLGELNKRYLQFRASFQRKVERSHELQSWFPTLWHVESMQFLSLIRSRNDVCSRYVSGTVLIVPANRNLLTSVYYDPLTTIAYTRCSFSSSFSCWQRNVFLRDRNTPDIDRTWHSIWFLIATFSLSDHPVF